MQYYTQGIIILIPMRILESKTLLFYHCWLKGGERPAPISGMRYLRPDRQTGGDIRIRVQALLVYGKDNEPANPTRLPAPHHQETEPENGSQEGNGGIGR
jgi:hypothetical protein